MLDKNGFEIMTGNVVRIDGAYVKKNNGLWFVESAEGDSLWSGDSYTLRKINKSGKVSVTEDICFWPMLHFCNNSQKNREAYRHDQEYATIEVIHDVPTCYVSEFFMDKANKDRQSVAFYKEKAAYDQAWSDTVRKHEEFVRFYEAVAESTKSEKPVEQEPQSGLRFYYNGVKIDNGRLIPCWYAFRDDSENADVVINTKEYNNRLPNRYFRVINESDSREDYFETDRAVITADNPLYKYARYAACQCIVKGAKRSLEYHTKQMQTASSKSYYEQQIASANEKIQMYSNAKNPGQPSTETLEALQMFRKMEHERKLAAEKIAYEAKENAIKQQIEEGRAFITNAMNQHPIAVGDPVVTFDWSENPAFYSWEDGELKTSLAAADMIVKAFDTEETRGEGGYDKTGITISYVDPWDNEQIEISGRYDLGDMVYNGIRRWIESNAEDDKQIAYLQWMLVKSNRKVGD